MNDTCSTKCVRRFSARIAIVLSLLLAIGVVPMAAFAAPTTVSDVEATYLNTATINLSATGSIDKTYNQLDDSAVEVGTSATTNVYGAHVLRFWSTDTSGNAEATITAPFFVDEDVLPVVSSDAKASYATTAAIEMTAIDNFNGSGVDFLCYRVDGGKIITVLAPAAVTATKLLMAKIAAIQTNVAIASVPTIGPDTTPPDGHYGPNCVTCHEIIIPTPEPPPTPEPTSTPVPGPGVSRSIAVTGVGPHTIEYWAQDIARNATAPVLKNFEIAPVVVVPDPVPESVATSTTLKASEKSIRSGRYITLTAQLNAARDGTFSDTDIRFEVLTKHSRHYALLKNVEVSPTGVATYRYKVKGKGKRYHRVSFLGNDTYLPAPLQRGIALHVK